MSQAQAVYDGGLSTADLVLLKNEAAALIDFLLFNIGYKYSYLLDS